MLRNWLLNVKNYYVDTVDPEGSVLKLSLRTALACTICILLVQLIGSVALSAWAGFAAFAFVQNDTQDLFFNRVKFLLTIIVIFTGLTVLGMLLGNNLTLFLLSVPVIVFVCAYPACLGFAYFNAGAWALFLYILAGAKPAPWEQAAEIGGTFLLCGAISLCISFFILPTTPYRKIKLSYERILMKLLLLFRYAQQDNQQFLTKYNMQLDRMLELQEKNMCLYLESTRLPPIRQTAFVNLAKSLWQISLMTKSTLAAQRRVSNYVSYRKTQLNQCTSLFEELVQAMIIQLKQNKIPHFDIQKNRLISYRDSLTQLRKEELAKPNPDFTEYLDYATLFYRFMRLFALLEESSQNISQLTGQA